MKNFFSEFLSGIADFFIALLEIGICFIPFAIILGWLAFWAAIIIIVFKVAAYVLYHF